MGKELKNAINSIFFLKKIISLQVATVTRYKLQNKTVYKLNSKDSFIFQHPFLME